MKNKRGFTLIELLAVIIILGILMLIAIPSVSKYIENSRKNTFVSSIKETIKGAQLLVNSGDIDVSDPTTSYYIPTSCINTEGGEPQSPYGKFNPAYVVVTASEDDHSYYFTGKDDSNFGISELTKNDLISNDLIESGVSSIDTSIGIHGTNKVTRYNSDCTSIEETRTVTRTVDGFGNPDTTTIGEDVEAIFNTGTFINLKIKNMAGTEASRSDVIDTNVKRIVRYTGTPSDDHMHDENVISASTSPNPIYVWYDESDGTAYWWTRARKPKLAPDSSMLFYDFREVETIDTKYFDTSLVTNMRGLFGLCKKLSSLDVSHFDTSKVTNMLSMFQWCELLTSIDVRGFNTSNVTTFHQMFDGCKNLQTLDVSGFDTSKVTSMYSMFQDCYALTYIDVSNWNTSNVTSMQDLFLGCNSLISVDVTHFDTSNVTNMSGMFRKCNSLTSLDVTHLNTSQVKNMMSMFYECTNLESIDVSHFNTSNVTTMSQMFYKCENLKTLNLSNFNLSKTTTIRWMFYMCNNFEELNLSGFVTTGITDMEYLFYGCSKLKTVYVSTDFDTSNVTNSYGIFMSCNQLVGENGTSYHYTLDSALSYAKIDGGTSSPGFFTRYVRSST